MPEYVKIEKPAFDGFVRGCMYGRMHALMLAAYQKKLGEKGAEKERKLREIDENTGLPTRKYMEKRVAEAVLTSERRGKAFSVGMGDIDHFKKVNDELGHQAGDELIVDTPICMLYALKRPGDKLGKYGGDEVLFLLPDTSISGAKAVARDMRKLTKGYYNRLAEEANTEKGKKVYSLIDLSCGTTMYVPRGIRPSKDNADKIAKDLIKRADKNMYRNKRRKKKLQDSSFFVIASNYARERYLNETLT